MDRLEKEFAGKIVFDRHNAATEQGQLLMAVYGLRAHPSFVLLAPDGKALWRLTGQIKEEVLQERLQSTEQD